MKFMFDNLKKVHLPFFLSFPFLTLFVINAHIIEFNELVWVILVCGVVGAVITALVKSRKVVLFISVSWMMFYIFGHIRLAFLDVPELWSIADFTAPIFTMGVAIIAFGFWKRRTDFKRATYFANIAGLVLMGIVVIQIGLFADQQPQFTATAVDVNLQETPNILYIIPDGYARSDILLDVYGYDNTPFTNALEDLGFSIGHGFSNYAHTHLSLSSALNMQYLDPTDWNLDYGTENHQYAKQMIEDNSVIRTLKENGYTLINIDSQFEATRSNPLFDYNYCATSATDNELLILFSNTALVPRGFGLLGDLHENRLCAFDTPETDEPYFVMMHIMMPHPPYLFDSDGNRLDIVQFDIGAFADGHKSWDTPEAYIEYLGFFNNSILDTIAKFDGLIIIQSDHGTHHIDWYDVPVCRSIDEEICSLDFTDSQDKQVYNRLANFMATNIEDFDPDRSPVNTWRQIFGMPLLEDKYYFSEYKRSYDFTDYTSVVNGLE